MIDSDNFDKADETILGTWTKVTGEIQLVSNRVRRPGVIGHPGFMICAYCGALRPWPSRSWWPSMIYAQCWPCAIRWSPRKRDPWLWRWLAARIRIDWRIT